MTIAWDHCDLAQGGVGRITFLTSFEEGSATPVKSNAEAPNQGSSAGWECRYSVDAPPGGSL